MGAPFDVVLTLVVSFLLRSFVYDCQKDFFLLLLYLCLVVSGNSGLRRRIWKCLLLLNFM